jgi:hypothetical protein
MLMLLLKLNREVMAIRESRADFVDVAIAISLVYPGSSLLSGLFHYEDVRRDFDFRD